MRRLLLASVAVVVVATPVSSQTDSEGDRVVTVRLQQVLEPMAADLDLPDVLLPETVEVPEAIATDVCGISPGEMAAEAGEQATCTAIGRSPELTRFVQDAMVVSGRPVDAATIDEDPDQTPDIAAPELGTAGEPGNLLDGAGELEETPQPPATATSPGMTGDDPLEAAPSDIREPAEQLPDLGADQQPSSGPPLPPAATQPGQTNTITPVTPGE